VGCVVLRAPGGAFPPAMTFRHRRRREAAQTHFQKPCDRGPWPASPSGDHRGPQPLLHRRAGAGPGRRRHLPRRTRSSRTPTPSAPHSRSGASASAARRVGRRGPREMMLTCATVRARGPRRSASPNRMFSRRIRSRPTWRPSAGRSSPTPGSATAPTAPDRRDDGLPLPAAWPTRSTAARAAARTWRRRIAAFARRKD